MKKVSLWERYLTKEIGIEFKACLYFFAILFYYCMYRVCTGRSVAEILHMAEMIFLAYAIGYIQVFLLWNFDESDDIGWREVTGIGICTAVYVTVSYLGRWFERNLYVTAGYAAYMVLTYVCVHLVYRCRRRIDDRILNSELELFKARADEKK